MSEFTAATTPPPPTTSASSSRFASASSEPAPKLAPFNPTDLSAQKAALSLLSLTTSDVLYDLGCGDGRFIFSAFLSVPGGLKKCVGIEYDSVYHERCLSTLATLPPAASAGGRVEFRHADVTGEEWEDATAIFVYLVPDGLKRIEGKLVEVLARGGRLVCVRMCSNEGVRGFYVRTGVPNPLILPPLPPRILSPRIASYMFSLPGLTAARTESTKGGCKVRYYDSTSLPEPGEGEEDAETLLKKV